MNHNHSTDVQEFYAALISDGRLRLRSQALPSAEQLKTATGFLLQHEQTWRRSLAGSPPAPDRTALSWAAGQFYRAAQFLVYRDLNEQSLQRELTVACPEPISAAVCYSVDLTFGYLPELMRIARAASEDDPLTRQLKTWVGEWPLSSVGVPGAPAVAIDAFIDDGSLRTLYVDRIIASSDVTRLEDERVREAARQALGAYPELAPKIAAAIDPLIEQAEAT